MSCMLEGRAVGAKVCVPVQVTVWKPLHPKEKGAVGESKEHTLFST